MTYLCDGVKPTQTAFSELDASRFQFNDACFVLGNLVGGGCVSLEEAREIALGLAREVDFPADSVEHIAVMEILEGKKYPMAFR